MGTSTAFTHIDTLLTHSPGQEVLRDAALVIEDGVVKWIGPQSVAPEADANVNCAERAVIPGFVDSHAHLAFAGDRSAEFEARMAGRPYAASGINLTVAATRAADDDHLRDLIASRVREMHRSGITTFETKSGYGLNVDQEARLLRLSAEVSDEVTFLGAHVVPEGIRRTDYLAEVTGPMLDACASAKWIDAFCEEGAITVEETESVLRAGMARGLIPRIHAGQLTSNGAIPMAVALGAASVDHCNHLSPQDVDALAGSTTVATLLPAADFSTRAPYAPARRLLDAGITVALATNCNPGSSYTTNMAFCIALAVREMGMSVKEAVWSATAGGAAALRRTDIGHLRVGASADLVVLDCPNPTYLAYRPGVDLIAAVYRQGVNLFDRSQHE